MFYILPSTPNRRKKLPCTQKNLKGCGGLRSEKKHFRDFFCSNRKSCYVILHFPADESITNRRGGGGNKAASRIPLPPHQGARRKRLSRVCDG